ncbi:LysM peptidoglycan-binding domain-containing protein [Oscillochloris sp. ZM17-4]|uniref:LysM peptidoglycan-binding domain-containing protein n=1 Tax=Oscillochloris sp. ZM17-4 TaxID=2866714 RepID=UPI001C736EEA|nr:LysM peptidoglycan-binding domain-containing protein [Oscillochloris sp. ZM17-4]MBX0327199.1 LysM peptidoglycan-binding domain-containing protein [Oscillochloris sp. ZM17-4]
MPELLVYLMLSLALLLPVLGAVALRLFAERLGARGILIAAAAIFGVAIASALILSRSDVGAIRVGDVSLLLPGTRPDAVFVLPADIPVQGDPEATPAGPPVLPTLTPRPSATATASPTPPPTATPTLTPEPPTATPEPPTATPEPPAGGRTYTVEPGDSLRSIAEQFGVSVEAILQANGLTPAQGDALRVGQELVIP